MSDDVRTQPGATPVSPSGILIVDKPKGFTSMDVCAKVRGRLRRGGAPKRVKVGHGGTLDPMATGLLVLLIGKATTLCDAIMAGVKEYDAEIDLSRRSTTDDAEGEVTPNPCCLTEGFVPPDDAAVRALLPRFVGTIMQRPPAFSALNVGGVRAYALARKGRPPELPARPVLVHEIELTSYAWPIARVRVVCGKGTYIRSLARDLGAALLGSSGNDSAGGMLTALRRTRVGRYSIADALTFESIPDPLREGDLRPIPSAEELRGAP